MEFNDLIRRALEIRRQYSKMEREKYGRAWTTEEIAMGLVGDVGDLMKLVMAHSGIRQIEGVDQKLAHELADCLWSLIILSQMVNVNLEQAFLDTMAELEVHLAQESLTK